tara:strand:+ start:611 stop:1345 length:735 start_codon:yes stop_codon:yes gene_type:complete
MHSSFTNIEKNKFDRRFGGTNKGVADPYISGYHFIYFKTLPEELKTAIGWSQGDAAIKTKDDIKNTLSASCMSVTPPGGTLNKAEFTGLGGTKWAVPTNIDYGNTLTVKFLEFSNLPILSIFHGWFRLIRDYRTGISSFDVPTAATFKQTYAGTLLYWTTKPDGKTLEYYAAYTGVFPTKDPQDSFSADITAYDKVEIDVEFNVDWIWHEDWVKVECEKWAEIFRNEGVSRHGAQATKGDATPF